MGPERAQAVLDRARRVLLPQSPLRIIDQIGLILRVHLQILGGRRVRPHVACEAVEGRRGERDGERVRALRWIA